VAGTFSFSLSCGRNISIHLALWQKHFCIRPASWQEHIHSARLETSLLCRPKLFLQKQKKERRNPWTKAVLINKEGAIEGKCRQQYLVTFNKQRLSQSADSRGGADPGPVQDVYTVQQERLPGKGEWVKGEVVGEGGKVKRKKKR
jgi:hypothetical protein